MIELKVADYCHGCPEFEPDVDIAIFDRDDFYESSAIVETSIACKHEQRCKSMKAYFKEQCRLKGESVCES